MGKLASFGGGMLLGGMLGSMFGHGSMLGGGSMLGSLLGLVINVLFIAGIFMAGRYLWNKMRANNQ